MGLQYVTSSAIIWTPSHSTVYTIYRQVLEVIAGVREEDPEELALSIYQNTIKLFSL